MADAMLSPQGHGGFLRSREQGRGIPGRAAGWAESQELIEKDKSIL